MKGRVRVQTGMLKAMVARPIMVFAALCWPMIVIGLGFLAFIGGVALFIGAIALFIFALAAGEYVILAVIVLLVVLAALTLGSDRILKSFGRQGLIRRTPGGFYLQSHGALRKR